MDETGSDTAHHYRGFKESLHCGRAEGAVIVVLIVLYLCARVMGTVPLWTVVLGLVCGTWLAFRPSEWAVEGIESIAGHMRATAYVAGMLSSLASNMPEAVVSGIAAYSGFVQHDQDLLDIAVLSVLVAAGFNMLLLGLTIVLSTHGKEDMTVPSEAIKKDTVLIRWTIVALASMFALGVVDVLFTTGPVELVLPPAAAFLLFISYLVYAGALVSGRSDEATGTAVPHHSRRTAAALTITGFVAIFFAGEVLTSSVEGLLEHYGGALSGIADPVTVAALVLGAAGAVPEHAIALVAAARGKIGIAVGNLIGGVLQIVLLVMGGIGVFVPIPLDRYVLFQIVVIAGSLWFLKRAITDDHQLDVFEGAMIMLLQMYVFVLLLFGTPV